MAKSAMAITTARKIALQIRGHMRSILAQSRLPFHSVRVPVSVRAMGFKLAFGALILVMVILLVGVMFLFFDPTIFYPKAAP